MQILPKETTSISICSFKRTMNHKTHYLCNLNQRKILQEKLQEHGTVHINYEVIKTSGPDHDKSFTVEVYCDGKALAIGEGKTKKQAEMQAAERALEKLA